MKIEIKIFQGGKRPSHLHSFRNRHDAIHWLECFQPAPKPYKSHPRKVRVLESQQVLRRVCGITFGDGEHFKLG